MALTLLYSKITEAIDNGNYVVGIFLDLAKAFDTVDHTILIKKTRTLWSKEQCIKLVCQLPQKQGPRGTFYEY